MAAKKKVSRKNITTKYSFLPLVGLTLFGLFIRIAFTLIIKPYDAIGLSPDGFSAEISRIAAQLAEGSGYAGAFYPGMPTAHIEPVYPMIMALVFKLWGICSYLSAILLTYLNVILSAATIPLVFFLAKKIYTEKVAWLSAWAFCMWPSAFWRSFNLWSETLAAFLFMIILILWVNWLDKPSTKRSIMVGLACGIGMLTTAACMSFIAGALLFVTIMKRPLTRPRLSQICSIVLTLCIVLAPWIVRNYMAFHKLMPVRSTAIVEFTVGNIGSTNGTTKSACGPHPYAGAERELYRKVGEIEYTKLKTEQFKEWLLNNPLQFIKLSALRIYWFWFGDPLTNFGIVKKVLYLIPTGLLMAWLWVTRNRKKTSAELLLLLFFCVYPLPYYVTSVTSRYRYLMEPSMLIVGMYAIAQLYAGIPRPFKLFKK